MSIQRNELRIGNIVGAGILFNDDGEEIGPMPSKVLRIFEDCIHWTEDLDQESVYKGYNSTYLESVQPIPLTPEWLERCGFERNEDKDVNGYLAYDSDRFYCFDVFINEQGKVCVHYIQTALSQNHPQYLHQFQNVIFALTGQELAIKEKV